ncbi:histidine kinase [Herbiconiux moechotypicola]|uniref:Histidine kinase/HSP90-like ATPase domain-containing protein n=1 Tax=Herbiconiux moechotypicola TaxID=637393 RepID=A0ABN3DEX5_9MICO|nr:histidine kinase [Herbiconiux moechotypicola]MCS5729345.1 histidine kinase [Herbiconiux moechotypicola]
MDRTGDRATVLWRLVAAAAVVVVVACAVVAVVLDLGAPIVEEFGSASSGTVPGLVLTIPGALLMWRLGPHPIAVVLVVFGMLWGLDGPAVGLVNHALATESVGGVADVLASWGFWYYVRLGAVLVLPIPLILLLFPDGTLATGVWRAVSIVSLALAAVMPLTFLLAPAEVLADGDPARSELLVRFDPGVPALPLPDALWQVLLALAFPTTVLACVGALAVTISRRRGATAERRAQLRWLTWAGLVFVALTLATQVLPTAVADVAFALSIAAVSVSIVIAVTRHGLYAIDGLLSWTLVYAILLAGVVVVDLALYLLVGSLFDDRVTMLLALLLVIVVYTPLRNRLARLVSRWVNGTRSDPYEVVSELAGRLEQAGDTQAQLDELARAVARAFASSSVRVELDRSSGPPLSASTGAPTDQTLELPLRYEGHEIGRILLQPGRRASISHRDRRLLGDIVRLAAAGLRNAELGRELQAIREGLVTTREEERARLRRELHDGIGPLLGGIRLRLETARNLAQRDPARSLAVLDTAIDESREVVDEIRGLVHALRPPALDDLGLARAVEQQAARLAGPQLSIAVTVDELPPLGAAVEVAAFRIVSEALTNVLKHSGAGRAEVRLRPAGERALVVEVADDGAGIPADRTAGVGLLSMTERAAELGGTVEFLPAEPGTLVRATLPVGGAPARPRASDTAVTVERGNP